MLKKRLIPTLFLKNGLIVRSQNFVDFREFGNPLAQLERLNDWQADELIYIDITREGKHDLKRDDHKVQLGDMTDILRAISKKCFMPLTFGGRIKSAGDASWLIENGADKIVINSAAYKDPSIIGEIAKRYGSQCVVVGIDVKRVEEGTWRLFTEQGRLEHDESPVSWAKKAENAGAGEIFLNSIDRDGTSNGYDLEIIEAVSSAVRIPVIACGGAGSFDDFEEAFTKTSASAVAAGNIFNFTENAYVRAKKQLLAAGVNVRLLDTHSKEGVLK